MDVSLITKTTLLGDKVMERFNFEKTAALMKVMGWKWAGDSDTPTADDLRSTARHLIYTMSQNTRINNKCSTGGLVLCRFEWENSMELELIFAFEKSGATGR